MEQLHAWAKLWTSPENISIIDHCKLVRNLKTLFSIHISKFSKLFQNVRIHLVTNQPDLCVSMLTFGQAILFLNVQYPSCALHLLFRFLGGILQNGMPATQLQLGSSTNATRNTDCFPFNDHIKAYDKMCKHLILIDLS